MEITIKLPLQDAGIICKTLAKADPLGLYHTHIIKRIDAEATKVMEAAKNAQVATPANSPQ